MNGIYSEPSVYKNEQDPIFDNVTNIVFSPNALFTTQRLFFKYCDKLSLLSASGWGVFNSSHNETSLDIGKFNCDQTSIPESEIVLNMTVPMVVQNSSYEQHLGTFEVYMNTGTSGLNFIRINVNPSWTYDRFTAIHGEIYLTKSQKEKFKQLFNL